MPLDLEHYFRLRPYLYHLTAKENLAAIRRDRVLRPAAHWLRAAKMPSAIRERRPVHLPVQVGGETIVLRDQRPLHHGNIRFLDGWQFPDVVEALNSRVYFWPGTTAGPVASGKRHFLRYADEDCVVLVLPARSVVEANKSLPPQFCRFNSGSPRCNGGIGSPRGPSTFLHGHSFDESPSKIVETVFEGDVAIPINELRVRPVNDWT